MFILRPGAKGYSLWGFCAAKGMTLWEAPERKDFLDFLWFFLKMLILRLEAKGSTLWGFCAAQGRTLWEEPGREEFLDFPMFFLEKWLF